MSNEAVTLIRIHSDKFDVRGFVHRKRIFNCNKQDATFTVTCHCRGRVGTLLSSSSSTTVAGNSKRLTNYPMVYIQFWAPDDGRRNRLKHVEHFTEINKLCNAASCWLYLKIYSDEYRTLDKVDLPCLAEKLQPLQGTPVFRWMQFEKRWTSS